MSIKEKSLNVCNYFLKKIHITEKIPQLSPFKEQQDPPERTTQTPLWHPILPPELYKKKYPCIVVHWCLDFCCYKSNYVYYYYLINGIDKLQYLVEIPYIKKRKKENQKPVKNGWNKEIQHVVVLHPQFYCRRIW